MGVGPKSVGLPGKGPICWVGPEIQVQILKRWGQSSGCGRVLEAEFILLESVLEYLSMEGEAQNVGT